MKKSPRIAIIGGGPGGLTLARVLWKCGINSVVFERDTHPLARPQGGTLDLHPESGQLAIRHAGLEAEFRQIARYEDQGMRIYDKHGSLLFDNPATADDDRPEVDRTALRSILLDSLPEGVVRWDHNFFTIRPQTDGTCEVVFANGATEIFDLVVGADGAWSRVRPLLSDTEPLYSGVTFVEIGIDDVDNHHPEVAALVGHGGMFALGDGKGLIAQRNGHAHIRVYAALRVPEVWWESNLDLSSPCRARQDVIAQFPDWASSLLELIRRGNDRVVARGLYALPIGFRWANRPGITLLGDAAHLMSPFSGQGVNNAMLDAAELALALAAADDWTEAVRAYEPIMLDRAEIAARAAAHGLDTTIAPNGLESALEWMRQVTTTES